MSITFAKATKKKAKLRLGLVGPSGSGKTYTALALASGLGGKIAVLDTEHGSASLYSDHFSFDVVELDDFNPQNYIDVMRAAATSGYEVIVLDSLSHAWSGKGGALELVDQATARSRSQNKFTDGWREVTPLHNELIETIVSAPLHVIATMRVKTEYVIEENERGKKVPRKVGLAPVQRAGMEYEFTVVADLDLDHNFIVSKTRCAALDGFVGRRVGENVAQTLLEWLDSGVDEAAELRGRLLAARPQHAEWINAHAHDLVSLRRAVAKLEDPAAPPPAAGSATAAPPTHAKAEGSSADGGGAAIEQPREAVAAGRKERS